MTNLKNTAVYFIALVLVLFFTYGAVTKTIRFEKFSSQLGASAGIPANGTAVGAALIFLLTLALILLASAPFRRAGLWLAFGLLSMFTVYTVTTLMYSSNLPCTCLGFFEKLSWKGNTMVNMGLMAGALAGIFLTRTPPAGTRQ